MKKNPTKSRVLISAAVLLAAVGLVGRPGFAQDRLKSMPGYERYTQMRGQYNGAMPTGGSVFGTWSDDGTAFTYQTGGKAYRFDLAAKKAVEVAGNGAAPTGGFGFGGGGRRRPGGGGGGQGGERPARGRQYTSALSPDGKMRAFYRDRNLWIGDPDRNNATAVTAEGSEQKRIKYGSASWVYGEELGQTTAMWWSPDSKKVAFYRFDESKVPDYYLTVNEAEIQNKLYVEPYNKVGGENPVVDVLVYDVETKKTTPVAVRDGKPFDNSVVGHYVYGIEWTPDGRELLFHRTNRRQNVLELCAADPATGTARVVVREEWPASWVENTPDRRFLADGKRFIWASERNGFKNFYLYDLSGKLLATLTKHDFEVANIVRVDEKAGLLYYTATDGDNPMKLQLHRVKMDGTGDKRLTDPAFHHSVDVSPDGRHFVDIYQTHDTPPATRLMTTDGVKVADLAASDTANFKKLGLKPAELLKFKAADGTTDLYGMLHFPTNFDPNKKYPLLVTVYAGPSTTGASETFARPNSLTEFGFLVASFDSRSASGRGKRFLDAIYQKLGQVEIDDQAAGVKSLWARPYFDKNRVGIFGTSYGGTASALAVLRYPDVFQAASASSAVTDFRNYDTIYAERYMWIPQENKEGFDKGSLMTYAPNLKGRLMIYYGTADDNVHPSNALQFIRALQQAGKSFEVQVGTDQGHTSVNFERMMEFFIENLVLKEKP